jgi:hypothetical protein
MADSYTTESLYHSTAPAGCVKYKESVFSEALLFASLYANSP